MYLTLTEPIPIHRKAAHADKSNKVKTNTKLRGQG